ncbi:MAG: DNA alkylation repair protein [bacterium]
MSSYSDRAHRPGQTGDPAPLLDSYNVPKPVIRQVLLDIKPLASQDSLYTLQLCDALWEEPYFEMRYLCASMLGMINPLSAGPVLERISSWSHGLSDVQLMEVLFDKGLDRIRNESPQLLIEQIDRWLDDDDISVKRLGLHALIPLIRSASYENICKRPSPGEP